MQSVDYLMIPRNTFKQKTSKFSEKDIREVIINHIVKELKTI